MMSLAIKAALLSGLVFPGLGQVVLTKQATLVLDRLAAQGGTIDIGTVSDAATRAATDSSSLMINLLLILMIGCWLFALVDAYRLGKQKDLTTQAMFEVPDNDDHSRSVRQ
ncbi:MAG: hypothetical protein HGJ94_16695 [Desulfosarcina sp.]|nr:hypothetical protein [Desulfosarcina sp.]